MQQVQETLAKSVLAPYGLGLRVVFTDPADKVSGASRVSTSAVRGSVCEVSLSAGLPEPARPYVLTGQTVMAVRVFRGLPEFGQTASAYDQNLAMVNVAATQLTHTPAIRRVCKELDVDVNEGLRATFSLDDIVAVPGAKLSPEQLGTQFGCLRLAAALCTSNAVRENVIGRLDRPGMFRIFLWAEELSSLVASFDLEEVDDCWEAMVALLRALDLDGYSAIKDKRGRYYFDGVYGYVTA